jgi:hypothetical protein
MSDMIDTEYWWCRVEETVVWEETGCGIRVIRSIRLIQTECICLVLNRNVFYKIRINAGHALDRRNAKMCKIKRVHKNFEISSS